MIKKLWQLLNKIYWLNEITGHNYSLRYDIALRVNHRREWYVVENGKRYSLGYTLDKAILSVSDWINRIVQEENENLFMRIRKGK